MRSFSVPFVAIFTGVFLFYSLPAKAMKPLVPLQVRFELGATPRVGGNVPVYLKVHSLADAARVEIRCFLPEGVELVSGEEAWQGGMKAGDDRQIEMVLRIGEAGKHLLRARATIHYPGGAKMSQIASLWIDLETEDQKKAKPDKDKKGPRIRKGKDGRIIQDYPLE